MYFLGIVSPTLDQRCRRGVRRSRGSYPSWGSSHRVQKGGSCCNDVLPRPCRWSSDPYSDRKRSRILEKWSIQTVCCFSRSWTGACSGKFDLARSFLAYLRSSDCLERSFRGEKNCFWGHYLDPGNWRSKPFRSRSKPYFSFQETCPVNLADVVRGF
jgi:hypothetical protein